MISRVNISKIALHPMLVTLPIGMWVFATIAQIIYVAGAGQSWRLAASYTMIGGVIGAIIALLPGLVDYINLQSSRPKEIATRHMLLNLTITVLFAIAFGLNIRGPISGVAPLVISLIAAALLVVSGFLGFTMVYRYRVSIPDEPTVRREPQPTPREAVHV